MCFSLDLASQAVSRTDLNGGLSSLRSLAQLPGNGLLLDLHSLKIGSNYKKNMGLFLLHFCHNPLNGLCVRPHYELRI